MCPNRYKLVSILLQHPVYTYNDKKLVSINSTQCDRSTFHSVSGQRFPESDGNRNQEFIFHQ